MYVQQILPFVTSGLIKSASYVTHSGLQGSVDAILPDGFAAEINVNSWTIPSVFGWIQSKLSKQTPEALANHFNLGIGLVMVVPKGSADWKTIDGAVEIGLLAFLHF